MMAIITDHTEYYNESYALKKDDASTFHWRLMYKDGYDGEVAYVHTDDLVDFKGWFIKKYNVLEEDIILLSELSEYYGVKLEFKTAEDEAAFLVGIM